MTAKRKVLRNRRSLVHCIADCTVCGVHWEDYLTAQKSSYKHANLTGHKVVVDLGYVIEYGARGKK